MSLKCELIDNKPREVSGSSSSNRFQFQKDWAICKLLELQTSDEEYVLILDFHDDVLIIDSSENPQVAKFYQVKTKANTHWTLNTLLQRKKESNSILGKMYFNKMTFPNHKIELNFISNAHFKLGLKDEESQNASLNHNVICLNKLDDDSLKKVEQKLKDEFTLAEEPNLKDITYLRVTELDIHSHDTYTKGKLSEYFDRNDISTKVNPVAAHRVLSSEFSKRNDYEWKINSFDEMIVYKGVTKELFCGLIDDLINHSKVYNEWSVIEQNLLCKGISLNEIKRIKQKWMTYELERLNTNNLVLHEIRMNVVKLVQDCTDIQDYRHLIDTIFPEYNSRYKIIPLLYDEYYIKAVILMEYCLC